jgi:ABC-type branched-subunit amino acid transport system ATPase component/ABC-type branched-subunit amino acid transport system permease subunit
MNAKGMIGAVALGAALVGLAWLDRIPGLTPGLICVAAFRALALIGLNLIFGVVGMLAFGQAAFMALSAYLAGIFALAGMPIVPALILALVIVVALARVLAEIFVRLPGIFLAVGTLGFGMVVEGLARAFPDVTGGASGLVFAQGRSISDGGWLVIAIAALSAGLIVYAWYVRGAVARCLNAIRNDELAASVLGIDVHREKAKVFTIGCAYSAVGGLLLFYYVGVLVPEDAGVARSLEQIGTLLLGGAGFIAGPLIGSFLVEWFFVLAGYAARFELLIYGAAFLAIVMFAPRGVSGMLLPLWRQAFVRKQTPVSESKTAAIESSGRAGSGDACLSVQNVSRSFGGLDALSDVSFQVGFGDIFCLIGPNGAGKTTLFNIVSGVLRPDAGQIIVGGSEITGLPIHRRAGIIGRSFQTPRLVPELSVLENVMLRIDQLGPKLSELEKQRLALAQLRIFELEALAPNAVGAISLGQRKLIDIARAAVGQPPLVLLDEPAVGLAAGELLHLGQMMRTLSSAGCAVVIVEHNIEFVSDIAARGIVLDSGKTIAAGSVREIMTAENVRAAYFGALP